MGLVGIGENDIKRMLVFYLVSAGIYDDGDGCFCVSHWNISLNHTRILSIVIFEDRFCYSCFCITSKIFGKWVV